jgi:hypothetical protein
MDSLPGGEHGRLVLSALRAANSICNPSFIFFVLSILLKA